MLLLDQNKILQALEALVTLTDFIHKDSSDKKAGQESYLDKLTAKPDTKTFGNSKAAKSLPNMLRRLILRIQPYISPTNSSPALAYKAL